MPTIEIPLGEFLPAFPKQNNPGCLVANNCVPAEGGYRPFEGAVAGAESVAGNVRGAALFFKNDSNPVIVGGRSTTLFIKDGSTLTETTPLTALGDGESWDFAQFNDFVFATSLTNNPQYLTDIDSDTGWSAVPGTPPKAKFCERFADFLMLGYIDGFPNRIQWSSFNSPATDWTASRLTQAGFADLDTRGGAISGLSGGRYPMVFQERAVSLVQYVGPPTVWRVTLVSEDRGCTAPFSICTVGSQTYFLSQDGFWMTNGSEFVPIGSQRVNKWFFDTANGAYLDRTQGAVDWERRCIVWSFVSADSDGDKDRQLIYSWEQNRFSTASIAVDWIVGSRVAGTTLEDLDALFATLEDVTPSLDSPQWQAGDRVLAAFIFGGTNSVYNTFTGPALQADWETGAFQPKPGSRVFVSQAQAVFDATDWTMQFATIAADNERVETTSAYSSPGVAGYCPLRADGKEMRLAARMPAGATWRRAQGAQLTFRPSGAR